MRKNYVSSAGLDTNPGTEALPLLTVAAAIAKTKRGDYIYLRRGDTFYEKLDGSLFPADGVGPGRRHIGAYGHGPRPVFCGYKISANSWVLHQPNVWRLNLTQSSGEFTGYNGTPVDAGHIVTTDNVIHGVKRWSLATLANDWDFYSDATYIYVYKATSPGAGIKIAVKDTGARVPQNSIVRDIAIVGWGEHGFRQLSGLNALVENCLIENIGGSVSSGTTRLGNGVEIWIGASNVTYRKNTIRQTYDVAMTMQGAVDPASNNYGWKDVHFVNNLIEDCNQSFEAWTGLGPAGQTGPGWERCSFRNNVCRGAGNNWAALVRPDIDGKGSHILTYSMPLNSDITISGNVFHGALHNYTYNSAGYGAGWKSFDNSIYLKAGQKISYQLTHLVEEHADYVTATGLEVGSRWLIEPTSVDSSLTGLSILAAETSYALEKAEKMFAPMTDEDIRDIPTEKIGYGALSTVSTNHVKIGTFKANGAGDVGAVVLSFVKTSNVTPTAMFGQISIAFAGKGAGAEGLGAIRILSSAMDYAPELSGSMKATNWKLVRTVNDTVNNLYEFELYLATRDTYSLYQFKTIHEHYTSGASGEIHRDSPLVAALPAGTVYMPLRPSTVTVRIFADAPDAAPNHTGELAIGFGSKKLYFATGFATTADWNILN